MNSKYIKDKQRYGSTHPDFALRAFLWAFRYYEINSNVFSKVMCKIVMKVYKIVHCLEISAGTKIGEGFYIGHGYCITINPKAVLGRNVNIHKGVTIGQENRGKRAGVPNIGDCVWIGVNSTIVGNIKTGNDVLIAPNSYVNCDVPDHCVVFGNPCIIKSRPNATEGYINNIV